MESTDERRPLGSLTQAECAVLFSLAFGRPPVVDEAAATSLIGPLTIRSGQRELILYRSGSILASLLVDGDTGLSLDFNAYKVVRKLQEMNVAFGESD